MEIAHIIKYVLGISSLFLIITLLVSYLLYRIRREPDDPNFFNNTPHHNTISEGVTPESCTGYWIDNNSYLLQQNKLLERIPLDQFNINGHNGNGHNGNGHNGNNGHKKFFGRIEPRFRIVNETMPERPYNSMYFIPEETQNFEPWVWETALEKILKPNIRN